MTSAEDVLDGIHGALLTADMQRHLDRPHGLTASAVGICRARAGFLLSNTAETDLGDSWLAQLGTYTHQGVEADLASANPSLRMEERHVVTIAGIEVPVKIEIFDPETGVLVELKTASPEDAIYQARHGGKPEHRMQVAIECAAVGATQGFLVYAGRGGKREDWQIVEVDLPSAWAEAEAWLLSVIGEEQDSLPRDRWPGWCSSFCPFATRCRGGYVDVSDEITDPEHLEAMSTILTAGAERKAAKKLEDGAWEQLQGVYGHAPAVGHRIVRWAVDATDTRRSYTRQELRKI